MAERETNLPLEASYSVVAYLGRDLPSTYRNMVFSKWLRSLRFGNDYFKMIDSDSYFKAYHTYLDAILARPGVVVRLAVLSDDQDVCLGFSVSEANTLHYVHVQRDFRKQGIAASLVPFDVQVITHVTNVGLSIWNNKCASAKFNPFA